MARAERRSALLVLAVLLVLAGSVPLLRASAASHAQAWLDDCRRRGGFVETLPAEQHNPLVVQTGHAHQLCRVVGGRILSERD